MAFVIDLLPNRNIQMKELDLSSFQYNHKHILALCADEHMGYLFDHEKIINVS